MMKLQEWIDSEERDYGIGLALLGSYCKNRILLQNLARKQNMGKLEYELKKAIDREKETAVPAEDETGDGDRADTGAETGAGADAAKVEETETRAGANDAGADTGADDTEQKKQKDLEDDFDEIVSNKLSELEYDAEDVISDKLEEFEKAAENRLIEKLKVIRDGKQIEYENLPEEIKTLWNENRDAYKETRALHEKLKLMENATPEDRQPLTERIASLDERIRTNWQTIDSWQPGQEPEKPEQTTIDHKRINSNRKYISTNLKKLAESKDEKLQAKIQERVDELKAAGEKLTEKTIEEMKQLGITF